MAEKVTSVIGGHTPGPLRPKHYSRDEWMPPIRVSFEQDISDAAAGARHGLASRYVYQFPPLAECRKRFEELIQGRIDWVRSAGSSAPTNGKEAPPDR